MTLAYASRVNPAAVPNALACAVFIITAFVLSGVAHVVWLRSAASMRLAFPVDCGISFRGKRLFGDHKMLRGFVMMIPATGAAFWLLFVIFQTAFPNLASRLWTFAPREYAVLGLWAGFGFMAGELPNSFMKRRLDIAPGTIPLQSSVRYICLIADRVDSILGMLLALSVIVVVPALTWIYVISFGAAIHWSFSAMLFVLGVKQRIA